jgi:hypothetical protein
MPESEIYCATLATVIGPFVILAESGTAGHVTHDKIRQTVLLAKVIDRHEGRMFQHGDRFSFALEALVIGMVDSGRVAASDLGSDLVSPEFLAPSSALLLTRIY